MSLTEIASSIPVTDVFNWFLTGGVAILIWALKALHSKMNNYDRRLSVLEKSSVDQAEFTRTISEIYSKLESGFQHLNDRLDNMYTLLLKNTDK